MIQYKKYLSDILRNKHSSQEQNLAEKKIKKLDYYYSKDNNLQRQIDEFNVSINGHSHTVLNFILRELLNP